MGKADYAGFTGRDMTGVRFRLDISGDKELMAKLNTLASSTQRAAVRPAAEYAFTPVNKAAKQNVPVDTGTLKKSIGKRAKSYSSSGTVWVGVGPRVGDKYEGPNGEKPWKYMHIVEFGSENRGGSAPLRRAFDANKSIAQKRLIDKTWDYIEKVARS